MTCNVTGPGAGEITFDLKDMGLEDVSDWRKVATTVRFQTEISKAEVSETGVLTAAARMAALGGNALIRALEDLHRSVQQIIEHKVDTKKKVTV